METIGSAALVPCSPGFGSVNEIFWYATSGMTESSAPRLLILKIGRHFPAGQNYSLKNRFILPIRT